MNDAERAEVALAKSLLESPSLAVRLTHLVGRPLERGVSMLPSTVQSTIQETVRSALSGALDFAVATMGKRGRAVSADRMHTLASATTGAVGGFFGLPGLMVELPATTIIMLRSIGDIARSEQQDLSAPETRLACLEVFALGGSGRADDAAETGYYAVRTALAKVVGDAVQHVAQRGLAGKSSPALVQLLEKIAARFGVVVQEKVALELFPVVGAVSGALINTVFISHFQAVARGHFIVRRLESIHGAEAVRQVYDSLP